MASLEQFIDQIDRLARRLMRNLECCDKALVACCGVTTAQAYSLIALAERGEMTMNELAAEMRVHGTTMTRMVDSLVEKGFVARRQDPEDRRLVRVMLSERGQEVTDGLQQTKREFFTAAFGELSDAERDAILKAIKRLDAITDELGAKCCAS